MKEEKMKIRKSKMVEKAHGQGCVVRSDLRVPPARRRRAGQRPALRGLRRKAHRPFVPQGKQEWLCHEKAKKIRPSVRATSVFT
jgi:hypothetical protein